MHAPADPLLDADDLARCLWTIGDATRLRILACLPTDPCCKSRMKVSEIATAVGLTQSTVSNHLARLRTLDIVHHVRECREVYYCINQQRVRQIQAALAHALKQPHSEIL